MQRGGNVKSEEIFWFVEEIHGEPAFCVVLSVKRLQSIDAELLVACLLSSSMVIDNADSVSVDELADLVEQLTSEYDDYRVEFHGEDKDSTSNWINLYGLFREVPSGADRDRLREVFGIVSHTKPPGYDDWPEQGADRGVRLFQEVYKKEVQPQQGPDRP